MYKKLREIFDYPNLPINDRELSGLREYFDPNVLPEDLVGLLRCFNGSYDSVRDRRFYTSVQIVEVHLDYIQHFCTADLKFPTSLIPIFADGVEIVYFLKANNSQANNNFVWSFCAGDGDHEIYLQYDSMTLMAQTLIEEHEIWNTNIYPGTEGHYIDRDELSDVQSKLNPNMYHSKQNSNKSPSGVKNFYEIDFLHSEWG